MQVRQDAHESLKISIEAQEVGQQSLDEGKKRYFKLFQESTFAGSRAAAKKMKRYAKRQTKQNQKNLFFHSSYFLARYPSEMLSGPNSPLLVLLQLDFHFTRFLTSISKLDSLFCTKYGSRTSRQ